MPLTLEEFLEAGRKATARKILVRWIGVDRIDPRNPEHIRNVTEHLTRPLMVRGLALHCLADEVMAWIALLPGAERSQILNPDALTALRRWGSRDRLSRLAPPAHSPLPKSIAKNL